MNLTEDILKVLQEVAGPTNKAEKDFVDKHKVQLVDDPEKQDPKVASGAPKPKAPKGQGAKGVKISDVEEFDGKKVDPKKQDDVKTKKDKAPKGKGIKGFKEAYKSGELDEKKLDPVNKKSAAKDFDNRKDKDIDNDGDVDSSDKYLHKRRKAISKATKEAVDPAKFVKGGNLKVKKNDVDSMLSKLFGNSKLSKEAEKNKAYKAGYKGGKNPYKKDTADFHLFILGQQAKSAE